MKVYVLHEDTHYVGGDVLSVHASQDGADAAADALIRERGGFWTFDTVVRAHGLCRSWTSGDVTIQIIEVELGE